ncbi:hypothetical protein SAMN05216548_12132 [Faunimonas pinastri]|uniref:Uncharacterized protein n=2 Tax=Faunimonas pinastri TaxID=1855383 RepID=A0A1H9PNT1_9HYPH|nr:hypothetical protein SAMN05216548_12132 [Faunimonas pinastri]
MAVGSEISPGNGVDETRRLRIEMDDLRLELEKAREGNASLQQRVFALSHELERLHDTTQALVELRPKLDEGQSRLRETEGRLAEAQNELDGWPARMAERDHEIKDLRNRLQEVESSASWRRTKPFRKLRKSLRKHVGI